jgi:hypothetical protein
MSYYFKDIDEFEQRVAELRGQLSAATEQRDQATARVNGSELHMKVRKLPPLLFTRTKAARALGSPVRATGEKAVPTAIAALR